MKNKKLGITASLICVTLGIALAIAGRLMGGYPGFYIDNTGIHTTSSHSTPIKDSVKLDKFNSMEIHADYSDVELVYSDKFAVEYRIRGNSGNPVCEVRNNRLIFQEAKPFRDYYIGSFTFTSMTFYEPRYFIKVMIPKGTKLSEAVFDIETGDLDISSIKAETLKITDKYGDVSVGSCNLKTLDIQMESGTLALDTVDASQAVLCNTYGGIGISEAAGRSLMIQMESSDLKAGRMNYSDTEIKNDYGNVDIEEASGEHLSLRMETGSCQIDRMDCNDTKLTNSFGGIRLGLLGEMDNYGFNLKSKYGDIRLENHRKGYNSAENNAVYTAPGDGRRMIMATCESGDIDIKSVK